jgi:hypothetical protein
MPFLTTLGMIAGGAGAVNNFITGSKMAREAEHGLAKFRHQELTNLAENLNPSLEAERQMRVAASKQRAAVVDVSQGMDAAQAMSTMAMGLGQTQDMEMKAFSSIMDKEYEADKIRVQEEQNMRNIIEQRNQQELQSLQAQAQAGKQMQASAITDFASLAVSAGIGEELESSEQGDTDPAKRRAAKRDVRKANRQARRDDGKGFLGENTAVGGFFRDIGQSIGGFFNF